MKSKIPSSSVPSALSVVSELLVETLPFAWELALGIRDFALELNDNQITSIL